MGEIIAQHLMDKYGVANITFDEENGNVIDYKSGAIGTITGATRISGWDGEGYSLSFDGIDDYVQFNQKVILSGTKTVRVVAKFSPDVYEASRIVLENRGNYNNNGFLIEVSGQALRVSYSNAGTSWNDLKYPYNHTISKTAIDLSDGKMHDILVNVDVQKNKSEVYIDNILFSSQTIVNSEIAPSNNLRLGCGIIVTGRNTNFIIDDLQIYNKALTPKDFTQKTLLKSNNRIYSFKPNEVLYETKMTSNNTPAPLVVSASSIYDTTDYFAWKAFNGTNNSLEDCWITKNTTTGWLQINYGLKIVANKVSITSRNTLTSTVATYPKDFNILASNDGVNYDTLGSYTNVTDWVGNETKHFYFVNEKPYQYYKIDILANNGLTSVAIGEILYSYITNLTQLPSDSIDNFIKYGTSSIEHFDLISGSKNYILQDVVSGNADGLRVQEINRKPLSIEFE